MENFNVIYYVIVCEYNGVLNKFTFTDKSEYLRQLISLVKQGFVCQTFKKNRVVSL